MRVSRLLGIEQCFSGVPVVRFKHVFSDRKKIRLRVLAPARDNLKTQNEPKTFLCRDFGGFVVRELLASVGADGPSQSDDLPESVPPGQGDVSIRRRACAQAPSGN